MLETTWAIRASKSTFPFPRRLRRRRRWRRLIFNSAGAKAGRPGDRREGLDQFADRKGEVKELGVGELRIDERDRPPRRFGEAIELSFAEPRDGFAGHRRAAGFEIDVEQHRLDRLDRANGRCGTAQRLPPSDIENASSLMPCLRS